MGHRTAVIAVVALTLSVLIAAPVSAAVFAKYDGFDGESKAPRHNRWIDVLSIDWGSREPGAEPTGTMQNLGFTLTFECIKAAPKVESICVEGLALESGQLHVDVAGGPSQLRYELKNVMVTSYHVYGPNQGPRPEGLDKKAAFMVVEFEAKSAEWKTVKNE